MEIRRRGQNGSAGPPLVPRRVFEARGPEGARWRQALEGERLRAELPTRVSELVLDSFDRRLQRSGLELVQLEAGPPVRCRLAAREGAPENGACPPVIFELERTPVFVWDLPHASVHRLVDVLEARALEVLGEHECVASRWAVLDDQGKAVAWLVEELHRVRPRRRGARAAAPSRRVVLHGVRGYGAEFERLARRLAETPALGAVPDEDFDPRTRFAPPRRTGGRWPKLTAGVPALAALARIGRAQLEVVRANAAGLAAGVDAEHLHDTRVALRRLRSLLSQMKGVLADEERESLGGELRWLAACTGPARDLDTLLLELRLGEPELRDELQPVLAALEAERARLQLVLVAELGSTRARELLARLRAVLAGKGDPERAGPKADEPFGPLLAKRLRKRWRQVVAQAERLEARSPAEDLHRLRIACKKLRYLLECCRGLVPKAELAGGFAHLKGLQSALGAVQDAEVQAALLRKLALEQAADAGPRAHQALGQLLERLRQKGRAARARHEELSAEFLSAESRAGFQALLRRLAGAERSGP